MIAWTALALLAAAVSPADGPTRSVFPGKSWERRGPADVGLDRGKLDAFREAVGGRGCVVRHGYLVDSWGDLARRGDVASACKPVFGHLLWKAVEEGRLASVDERVARFEPRLLDLNPGLGHKDRAITFRQMIGQTSCYGVSEPPGAAFDYNDWQMALFFDTLTAKVFGVPPARLDDDLLHPRLTDPIGCEDLPTLLAFGAGERTGRLAISPRDFARVGLLYMHGGKWGDRLVLRADLVDEAVHRPWPADLPRTAGRPAALIAGRRTLGSTKVPDNQTDHFGSYSHAWWVNGLGRDGRRNWPAAPVDTFAALGHGGRRALLVVPSLDLVVSWNDSTVTTREAQNEALRRLVAAVTRGR